MVGFGSSLRMGRRTGWESAYLDYETLKLLLSQIEAVYEEQNNTNYYGANTAATTATGASSSGTNAIVRGGGGDDNSNNLYGQYSHSFLPNHHHHDDDDDGHDLSGSDDEAMDAEHGDGGQRRTGRQRRRHQKAGPVDYRDQLFLESDSDAAFASDSAYYDADRDIDDSSTGDDGESGEGSDDYYDNNDRSYFDGRDINSINYTEFGGGVGTGQAHHRQTESATSFGSVYQSQQQHQPFLNYSTQYSTGYSSSEESGGGTARIDRCGGVPWRKEKKSPAVSTKKKSAVPSTVKKKKRNKRRHSHGHHHHRNHAPAVYDEDDYFPTHRPAGPNTFIIAEESGSGYVGFGDSTGVHDDDDYKEKRSSFEFTNSSDQLPILPPSQSLPLTSAAVNSSLDATASDGSMGGGGFTDTTNFVNSGLMGFSSNPNATLQPSILPPASSPSNLLIRKTSSKDGRTPRRTNNTTKKRDKKEETRRRAQRARRRRRLADLRKERDRKVPPTLRLAHAKSRAIAGRFLGLLRAEVEKVVLFAQARLGELAETAGGLRFMSSEDLTEFGEQGIGRSAKSSYDYSFSDGGIHPSASSSSDEGVGTMGGPCRWSDSSSDEESKPERLGSAPLTSAANIGSPVVLTASREGQRNQRVPISENQEKLEATIRKINHFEVARKKRPIFSRNAEILGDELLLMSAVDEADAYSAVGVELLHVLRFISINTIAVRKLIKKHDRLLMNRMLGGYYHRERSRRGQEEMTLGGLVAHVSGDVYEAHPALVNHGKLMGVFDMKIQQLANSRTVKVVSSCLALALSEYEVSRNRADALAKLNPAPKNNFKIDGDDNESKKSSSVYTFGTMALSTATSWVKGGQGRDEQTFVSSLQAHDAVFPPSDDESEGGPPSTTSSLSLCRLQYTVLTIAALREAARSKSKPYQVYVCRGILTFTGRALVGAGLDGCSRESLDAILAFNPDAPLLLDSSSIYEGLKGGHWRKQSVESVMTSSLAVALSFPGTGTVAAPVKISPKTIRQKEDFVSGSLSILPKKSEEIDSRSPFDWFPLSVFMSISRFVTFPLFLLRSHRISCFLYTMNYFVVHPTAMPFVLNTTANKAYSAIIIGAPCVSAIIVSLIHCHILSDQTSMGRKPSQQSLWLFRYLFFFSAFAAIVGNIVHARGIAHASIPHAVLGRFILGFASSEIVQRQFISSLMPLPLIAAESARLSHLQIIGQLSGLLFGSFVAWTGVLVSCPWFMMSAWIVYIIYVACGDISYGRYKDSNEKDMDWEILENKNIDDSNSDQSESSGSDQGTGGPAQLFQRSSYMEEDEDDLEGDIANEKTGLLASKVTSEQPKYHLSRATFSDPPKRMLKGFQKFTKRFRKLMAFNISIPVTLAIIFYCRFSMEAFISSSPMLGYHYFYWTGQRDGCFLVFLTVLLVPTDILSEQIARRYEERIILKRGVVILAVGLFVMVNWESIFGLLPEIQNLLDEDIRMRRHQYNWFLGKFQYVIGLTVSIVALRSMDVASCSLLSKVAPPDIRRIALNVGTIATFVGLFGQVLADLQIAAVVLSHRLINSDVVNALVIPMFLASFLVSYFVRKHFFFLM